MFRRRKHDDDFPDWDIPDLPDDSGWEEGPGRGRGIACLGLLAVVVVVVAGSLIMVVRRGHDVSPVVQESTRSLPEETGAITPAAPTAAAPTLAAPTLAAPTLAAPTAAPTLVAPTLAAPTAAPATLPTKPAPGVYDPVTLAAYMLALINADRAVYGLAPVAWDETAAQAGARHAEDMIAHGYFAHWNTEGLGPDHRYALLGGEHAVMENLHSLAYTYDDGSGGAQIEDWASVIEQAQAGLMLSPGHRANILDPAHTHVGIGMAYNPASGEFRLAQEFTNQYVTLSVPPPAEAPAGSTVRVAGRFADGPFTNFILSLADEPWPNPMTPDELNSTYSYRSAAESHDAWLVDRAFDETITFGGPGLYHVRLYVDLPTGQAMVVDRLVDVR